MNFVFLGACDLKAVTIESKIESPEEWAHIEWGRTVKSVEKWLKNNNFEGISLNSLFYQKTMLFYVLKSCQILCNLRPN